MSHTKNINKRFQFPFYFEYTKMWRFFAAIKDHNVVPEEQCPITPKYGTKLTVYLKIEAMCVRIAAELKIF